MAPIRIVTLGLSKILEGIIIESFSERGCLDMVGHFSSINNFMNENHEDELDVIIVESKDADQCPEVLHQYPSTQVVSIETHGKHFSVWRMVPEKKQFGEISSRELADIIYSIERGDNKSH